MTNFEFDLINKTKKMVLLSQKYLKNIFNSKKLKNFKITDLSGLFVNYGVITNKNTFIHNYILDNGYIKICIPYKYINGVEYYGQPFIINEIIPHISENCSNISIMMSTKYPYYKAWCNNNHQPITTDEVPYCLDKPLKPMTLDELKTIPIFKTT